MKKIASFLLSIALMVGLCSTTVFAAGADVTFSTGECDIMAVGSNGEIELKIKNNTANNIVFTKIESVTGSDLKTETPPTFSLTVGAGKEALLVVNVKRVSEGTGRFRGAITGGGKSYPINVTYSKLAYKDPNAGNSGGNTGDEFNGEPSLAVVNLENKILTPGKTEPFYFQMKNYGYAFPSDIRVRVDGEGDVANKFALDTNTGWDTIEEAERKLRYLTVSSDLKDGLYNLIFSFSYSLNGAQKTVTDKVSVYVQNTQSNVPYVKSTAFDKAEIGKANKAKLKVKVVNPTGDTLHDVRISLNTEASQGFTLYENFQPVSLGDITGGSGTKEAVFSMYVASTVVSGNYPVVFDISYRDINQTINTIKTPVYAEVVRTPDAEGGEGEGSKPRIIVSKYAIDVDSVEAGKPFELDFTLQNTSASTAVGNIKVTIGSDAVQSPGNQTGGATSAVFFPAAGSNSFFIESMKPKATSNQKIKLMANSDVQPGVYPVVLNIVYDSGSETENISFPVNQPQRLDIIGLNIPQDAMGGMIPLSFQYINKGKATINNFTIAVEGDFTLEGGDTYIGNLTAGYNDYFDSSLIANGEGPLKGTIVFKYEDSQGEPKEQRKDFTVNVTAMEGGSGMIGGGSIDIGGQLPDGMVIDPETGMPIPAGGGFPWVLVIVIVGVVLVAGGVVTFIIIRKKRKAKKVLVNDEED